jgi:ArsR family transcriptional regulator
VLTKPRGAKRPARIPTALLVADQTIDGLVELFNQLADGSRFRILLALSQEGELHVSALCDALGGQSQPAVSHHLKLLRTARLVGYRREGKHNYYRLESSLIRNLLERFFHDIGNGHKQIQFEDFALSFKLR